MRSVKILFLLLILGLGVAGAQSNVKTGNPYVVVDASEKYYFARDNEILSVKLSGKTITLQKFNSGNLNFQKIRLYEDLPKGFQIEKVTKFKDRYFVFYSLWDGESEQLFYREIDFKEGNFKRTPELLLRIPEKVSGSIVATGFYRFSASDKFDFFFSYDSSKMLIQARKTPEIRDDSKSHDVIAMHVYDENLKKLWSNDVEMPYTEKKMDNLDYAIDQQANAYVVARVYDDDTTDKKNKEGNPNYHIELLGVNSSNSLSKTPVQLADKFLQTIWLYENPKGFMICAGFYNIGKNSNSADGIILFKLSPTGEVYDMATYEIPVEILNQYSSGKSQRKNKRRDEDDKAEFENLNLKQVLIEDDGSLLLVGEQNFIQTYTSYSPTGGSTTRSTYHYYDILAVKIDAADKLSWIKKLPKRQIGSAGRGGMSFHYIRGKKQHYFLFLDNENNRDLLMDEVPAVHSDGAGGFLTAYGIENSSGEVSKVSILNTRNVNEIEVFQFMPSRIVAITPTDFVVEVYKKKKEDILIKVNLEK
jgi:hypothetical protein